MVYNIFYSFYLLSFNKNLPHWFPVFGISDKRPSLGLLASCPTCCTTFFLFACLREHKCIPVIIVLQFSKSLYFGKVGLFLGWRWMHHLNKNFSLLFLKDLSTKLPTYLQLIKQNSIIPNKIIYSLKKIFLVEMLQMNILLKLYK